MLFQEAQPSDKNQRCLFDLVFKGGQPLIAKKESFQSPCERKTCSALLTRDSRSGTHCQNSTGQLTSRACCWPGVWARPSLGLHPWSWDSVVATHLGKREPFWARPGALKAIEVLKHWAGFGSGEPRAVRFCIWTLPKKCSWQIPLVAKQGTVKQGS